jgi:hypothetical protein
LQRDFGGEFRRLDQFEEGMFFLELAVFRQRAPGLAHEPDRRAVHRLAGAGVRETAGDWSAGAGPDLAWIGGNSRSF